MRLEQMTVCSNCEIAANIYEMRLKGDLVNDIAAPGQFLHIRVGQDVDALLRRPISIADVDKVKNELTIIFRTEGKGTTKLAAFKKGEKLDCLGPLGNGFSLDVCQSGDRALIVGGGVGVPPLYGLSKQLVEKGVKVTHVLGFSDASAAFYENEFSEFGLTYLATVDGSVGTKGFVTDVIKSLDYDVMFACGPIPMLSALEKEYSEKPLYLSLEERMGCGIGACYACVCHTANDPEGTSYKKVCTDGPVFKAGEVVYA